MVNRFFRIALLLVLLASVVGCKKEDASFKVTYGIVMDPAGQSYRWNIMNPEGGKVWMLENLNYAIEGYHHWWYRDKPENGALYGRLYDWEAAKAACAALGEGWHLPTAEEWETMVLRFGGAGVDASEGGGSAYRVLIDGGGSGFDALLGGSWYADGTFINLGDYGDYWGAKEVEDFALVYSFVRRTEKLYHTYAIKETGRSCRCVKDSAD